LQGRFWRERYLALNPVAAGLGSRAEDWAWSSARAHLAGQEDELAIVGPLRTRIPDFASLLAAACDEAVVARLERAATIGRPLGLPAWITMLEARLGRSLAPCKPGPKPQRRQDVALATSLPGIM